MTCPECGGKVATYFYPDNVTHVCQECIWLDVIEDTK